MASALEIALGAVIIAFGVGLATDRGGMGSRLVAYYGQALRWPRRRGARPRHPFLARPVVVRGTVGSATVLIGVVLIAAGVHALVGR